MMANANCFIVVQKAWSTRRSLRALLVLMAFLGGEFLANSFAVASGDIQEFIPETLGQAQKRLRLEHAQELLGRYYKTSLVRSGENIKKINSQIYRWTREKLPTRYKTQAPAIAQTIIDESLKHGFDPVFLLSVIQSESQFNPDARGGHGEIGLMQILPTTGAWIAKKIDIRWQGPNTLRNNITSIKLGAAYFAFLRDRFDMHARLYIAAYNMGQRNVHSALSKNVWPKDYPSLVMKNYVEFYSSLQPEAQTHEQTPPHAQERAQLKSHAKPDVASR